MGAPRRSCAADLHHLAGHAAADHADDRAVALVEGQELAAVVLDDVHDVVGLRLAEALDLDVVLVAPEVRHHDGGRQSSRRASRGR